MKLDLFAMASDIARAGEKPAAFFDCDDIYVKPATWRQSPTDDVRAFELKVGERSWRGQVNAPHITRQQRTGFPDSDIQLALASVALILGNMEFECMRPVTHAGGF